MSARSASWLAAIAGWLLAASTTACAQSPTRAEKAARLVAAYPNHLARLDGNEIVWRDGTRMPFDDGKGEKPFAEWLAAPDIEDMLAIPYPPGDIGTPPLPGSDPGRARNLAFFAKMYGDCRTGGVTSNLVEMPWLPKKGGGRLKVTRINGVSERLARISAALDQLPASFDVYLLPSAGTYVCRPIAGTNTLSAHGFGIAIDIALKHAHYWRWAKPKSDGSYAWRNAIPLEIVRIFEAEGFIWGGKWHHFDTMHFEYRPELSPPVR